MQPASSQPEEAEMPVFTFRIEREYTITEGFDREFEANTLEEAEALAEAAALEADMDCPDDCAEDERGYTHLGDFSARRLATEEV
jgi:hypothetical protein